MNRIVMRSLLLVSLIASYAGLQLPALANDWPLVPGDFYEVTGVKLKDGGALAYAQFLSKEWKADQEFAKSKGWIKSYMVLSNNFPRDGEPDLYLVITYERMPSGAESDKRDDEYTAFRKKSDAQLMKESGNRLEIREIKSTSLLQQMTFR